MAQEQTKRAAAAVRTTITGSAASGQERREKLTEETDDLLDEIDDVLERTPRTSVRIRPKVAASDLAPVDLAPF